MRIERSKAVLVVGFRMTIIISLVLVRWYISSMVRSSRDVYAAVMVMALGIAMACSMVPKYEGEYDGMYMKQPRPGNRLHKYDSPNTRRATRVIHISQSGVSSRELVARNASNIILQDQLFQPGFQRCLFSTPLLQVYHVIIPLLCSSLIIQAAVLHEGHVREWVYKGALLSLNYLLRSLDCITVLLLLGLLHLPSSPRLPSLIGHS